MRKFIALGLALAFLVMFPLVVWSVSLELVLLNRATYADVLEHAAWYESMIPDLLPTMMMDQEMARRQVPQTDVTVAEVFGALGPDDWRAISELLIPEDWLYTQISHNIGALFNWFETDEAIPDLRVDTSPIRMNVLGLPGREVAGMLILSWDRCTAAQEDQLQKFLDGAGDPVLCQPPGSMIARMSSAIAEPAMGAIASEITGNFDYYRLVWELSPAEQDGIRYGWNALKYNLNLAKRLFWMSYLFPLALLALIVILVVRNAHAFFAWVGWPLLIGGFLSLLLPVLLLLSGLGALGERVAVEINRGIEARQAGILLYGGFESVMTSLIGAYSQPMLIQSAIAIVIGFAALFLAASAFKAPEESFTEMVTLSPEMQSAIEARIQSEVESRLQTHARIMPRSQFAPPGGETKPEEPQDKDA
ncbi:MAG: hypothetical protein JXB47_15115 [Anaerolineae bacterium]|nr:hypothetical protein [Anaerolineae bacterium]